MENRYIKGVGMTKFGHENRNSTDMIYEATLEALDDADMTMKDIEIIIISNGDSATNGERQRLFAPLMNSLFQTRVPSLRIPAVCGGGGAALWSSIKLDYSNILVIGCERLLHNHQKTTTDEILMAAETIWEQKEGMIFPAQNALVAQQHMLRYGSTLDDLALVAYKNHKNANSNPKAFFYDKKVSLKDIKKSPIVASPLRLFDCSVNANGSAACILTKDKTDVLVKSSILKVDSLPIFEREDLTIWDASVNAAKEAYKQAGISASDIDFAEIHDAFTSVEIISYEDLGFAERGKGHELIRDGKTNIDGSLPVNTSGGLKAKGHPISATGLSQIYEITKQMRNEAGDRQLTRNKYALAQNIGGAGGTAVVHILQNIGG